MKKFKNLKVKIAKLEEDQELQEYQELQKYQETQVNQALETLQFIIDSNGGLTDTQIKYIKELIEAGYIEAIDECTLIIHN